MSFSKPYIFSIGVEFLAITHGNFFIQYKFANDKEFLKNNACKELELMVIIMFSQVS